MHNRVKTQQTEAERHAQVQKAKTYSALVSLFFERKRSQNMSPETLVLTAKMLRNNPDFYTLWNFRREILIHMYGESLGLTNDPESVPKIGEVGNSLRDQELELSADGIRRNPKSYGAWYHRQWIVNRFIVDRDAELALCRDFLKADQRNFHCWAYRRFVTQAATDTIARKGVELSLLPAAGSDTTDTVDFRKEEYDYSTEKIAENFSNYSSFHHRSVYLRQLNLSCRDCLETELAIVENAIFTEPDDQSAWWYHQFLLVWAGSQLSFSLESDQLWFRTILEKQLDVMNGLLEMEAGCKWAMTCVVNIIDSLSLRLGSCSGIDEDTSNEWKSVRRRHLVTLSTIDPMHASRYQYLLGRS